MAIKNLADQINYPRVGKIHLGIKDPDKGYPKMVDYFVVKEEKTTNKEAVQAFKDVYGDKPNRLDILIPCENKDVYFPQWLKEYNSKQLVCRGDGEAARRLQNNGEYKDVICKGQDCLRYKAKKCREIANFKFLLPKVAGIGVWQIDTSSINSIININSVIEFIKQQAGRISNIPLTLYLQQKDIIFDGKKKTIYVMNISSTTNVQQIISDTVDSEYPEYAEINDIEKDTEFDDINNVEDVDDYPIDELDEEDSNESYEIVDIGILKNRNALKLKTKEKESIIVLVKDQVEVKKGTRIIGEIEQHGKYNVLKNYKIA